MNTPKLTLRVSGSRVYCGRPGCDRLIGRVDLQRLLDAPDMAIIIPADDRPRDYDDRWHHRDLDDGTMQWERSRGGIHVARLP